MTASTYQGERGLKQLDRQNLRWFRRGGCVVASEWWSGSPKTTLKLLKNSPNVRSGGVDGGKFSAWFGVN